MKIKIHKGGIVRIGYSNQKITKDNLEIRMDMPIRKDTPTNIPPTYFQRFQVIYRCYLGSESILCAEMAADCIFETEVDEGFDFTNGNHLKGNFKTYTGRIIDGLLKQMVSSMNLWISQWGLQPDNVHMPEESFYNEVKDSLTFSGPFKPLGF